jgi:UDP-N-acetylglucosamine--N-acetylmuramyl-(pentapeptide) pyrophosphoryl-undecaprenol N-acetylglucosamine transferase
MRVLISGGGTGGHVYPALAVAAQLTQPRQPNLAAASHEETARAQATGAAANPASSPASATISTSGDADTIHAAGEKAAIENARPGRAATEPLATALLWLGSEGGMEKTLVERHEVAFRGIRTGQLRGVNPLKTLFNIGKMVGGYRQALAVLDEFRPHVCLATGGYVCVPVVAACRRRGIPVMIYLPDMTPGWAIRLLSRLAQRVAVTHPEAATYFGGEWPQGKAVVTGYPVRGELVTAAQDRQAARQRLSVALDAREAGNDKIGGLHLQSDAATLLLVWGASQGARSINRATWAALDELIADAHVLHIVGTRDWSMALDPTQNIAAAEGAPEALSHRYCAVDYLHETMIDALAAADLTVGRAGASILGEFTVTGLPSVLVPLPIAGGHQQHNAEALAAAGAAVILDDAELSANLIATVRPLLRDANQRHRMAQAARALAKPQAAAAIGEELWKLAFSQREKPNGTKTGYVTPGNANPENSRQSNTAHGNRAHDITAHDIRAHDNTAQHDSRQGEAHPDSVRFNL